MLIDLHTHTAYSYDAADYPVRRHVQAAVQKRIDVLGFTEHVDFFRKESLSASDFSPDTVDFAGYEREIAPFRRGRAIMPDLAAQQRDIAACRAAFDGQIALRMGVELGQPHAAPALADALLGAFSFDYVIGSVHQAAADMDLYFYRYEQINQDEFLHAYFDEMEALVAYGRFHILGHIDYPLRVMKLPHNRPSLKGYLERVDVVLQAIIERGIALECNAKGLFGWQQAVGPEDCVLARYRELGGEYITTGSDSHAPDNIGAGIAQALDRLRAFGFSYVTDFENGTAIQHRL